MTARSPRGPSRGAYLGTTLVLAAAAVAGSAVAGWGDPAAVAAGVLGAWAIQAVAYWWLVAALDEGRNATRAWVLGMGARFGGLALVFVAATLAPEGASLLLAFGGAILVFLLLEAAWLALRPPESSRAAGRRTPEKAEVEGS